MLELTLKKIEDFLMCHVSEERRVHTSGVLRESVRLSQRYGVNTEKARLAALSHDMLRDLPLKTVREMIPSYKLDPRLESNRDLSHGKLAARLLEEKFQITDREILDAVSYHTTGRAGMTPLEKVLYVADAIEENRQYPGVEELRRLAEIDLDLACIAAIKSMVNHIREQGKSLDQKSIHALNWMESKQKEKGHSMNNREIAQNILQVLSDKKASDLVLIDIAEKSSFADYLIIATGSSTRQIGTLTDEVVRWLEEEGVAPKSTEGRGNSGWVLIDSGDVLINIFSAEQRARYNIEKIWGDGTFLPIEE